MDADVLAEAVALVRARRAFVARDGRVAAGADLGPRRLQGDRASRTGTVHGFLGGACAEPTLVREALASLADGRPRLLFLGPADELAHHERDGTRTIPMACESEGALEVHIEPFLPMPQLVVVGRSPAVHALAIQARAVGWDVVVIDDGGDPAEHPFPELVRTTLDLYGARHRPVERDRRSRPKGTTTTCARARARDRCRRTSVSSRRRSARPHCSSTCAIAASATRTLARVHAPAGLDLGAVTNAEIAVAVLADLVARRAGRRTSAVSTRAGAVEKPSTRCAA